uniref:G-protein coupled receptors family 1 profile domain-containing protein n=1 Tax=Chinchilla lanigera TaxID=34839 RepID=A0A8C2UNN9_CHILA
GNGANWTAVTEYEHHNLEGVLFGFFLGIYCVTVLGNSLLIGLITLDPHLHNPMHFFLSNLSLTDICDTSSFVPFMLANFLETRRTISFPGCAPQMCLTLALGATESLLLAVMAYDRYVAICQPSEGRSGTGFATSLLQATLVWGLPLCGHSVVNHFFCEILAGLKLACGDVSLSVVTLTVTTAVLSRTPLLRIFLSYIFILVAILRVPSATGRCRAFSTCSAHLTVVVVFHGTISFMHFKPKAKDPNVNKITTFLRNTEVKAAVTALLGGGLLPGKM